MTSTADEIAITELKKKADLIREKVQQSRVKAAQVILLPSERQLELSKKQRRALQKKLEHYKERLIDKAIQQSIKEGQKLSRDEVELDVDIFMSTVQQAGPKLKAKLDLESELTVITSDLEKNKSKLFEQEDTTKAYKAVALELYEKYVKGAGDWLMSDTKQKKIYEAYDKALRDYDKANKDLQGLIAKCESLKENAGHVTSDLEKYNQQASDRDGGLTEDEELQIAVRVYAGQLCFDEVRYADGLKVEDTVLSTGSISLQDNLKKLKKYYKVTQKTKEKLHFSVIEMIDDLDRQIKNAAFQIETGDEDLARDLERYQSQREALFDFQTLARETPAIDDAVSIDDLEAHYMNKSEEQDAEGGYQEELSTISNAKKARDEFYKHNQALVDGLSEEKAELIEIIERQGADLGDYHPLTDRYDFETSYLHQDVAQLQELLDEDILFMEDHEISLPSVKGYDYRLRQGASFRHDLPHYLTTSAGSDENSIPGVISTHLSIQEYDVESAEHILDLGTFDYDHLLYLHENHQLYLQSMEAEYNAISQRIADLGGQELEAISTDAEDELTLTNPEKYVTPENAELVDEDDFKPLVRDFTDGENVVAHSFPKFMEAIRLNSSINDASIMFGSEDIKANTFFMTVAARYEMLATMSDDEASELGDLNDKRMPVTNPSSEDIAEDPSLDEGLLVRRTYMKRQFDVFVKAQAVYQHYYDLINQKDPLSLTDAQLRSMRELLDVEISALNDELSKTGVKDGWLEMDSDILDMLCDLKDKAGQYESAVSKERTSQYDSWKSDKEQVIVDTKKSLSRILNKDYSALQSKLTRKHKEVRDKCFQAKQELTSKIGIYYGFIRDVIRPYIDNSHGASIFKTTVSRFFKHSLAYIAKKEARLDRLNAQHENLRQTRVELSEFFDLRKKIQAVASPHYSEMVQMVKDFETLKSRWNDILLEKSYLTEEEKELMGEVIDDIEEAIKLPMDTLGNDKFVGDIDLNNYQQLIQVDNMMSSSDLFAMKPESEASNSLARRLLDDHKAPDPSKPAISFDTELASAKRKEAGTLIAKKRDEGKRRGDIKEQSQQQRITRSTAYFEKKAPLSRSLDCINDIILCVALEKFEDARAIIANHTDLDLAKCEKALDIYEESTSDTAVKLKTLGECLLKEKDRFIKLIVREMKSDSKRAKKEEKQTVKALEEVKPKMSRREKQFSLKEKLAYRTNEDFRQFLCGIKEKVSMQDHFSINDKLYATALHELETFKDKRIQPKRLIRELKKMIKLNEALNKLIPHTTVEKELKRLTNLVDKEIGALEGLREGSRDKSKERMLEKSIKANRKQIIQLKKMTSKVGEQSFVISRALHTELSKLPAVDGKATNDPHMEHREDESRGAHK